MRPDERQQDADKPTGKWPLFWVFAGLFGVSIALIVAGFFVNAQAGA